MGAFTHAFTSEGREEGDAVRDEGRGEDQVEEGDAVRGEGQVDQVVVAGGEGRAGEDGKWRQAEMGGGEGQVVAVGGEDRVVVEDDHKGQAEEDGHKDQVVVEDGHKGQAEEDGHKDQVVADGRREEDNSLLSVVIGLGD